MKKIYILLLLSLLASIGSNAQTMSVESFIIAEKDMDARINAAKVDPNGKKAALIKIETTEKGFGFDVGQLGIVDVDESKIAQVWVYIPQGAIRMKIMHQQLGILEYEFPTAIKEATVYNMKLTTAKIHTIYEEDDGGQFFILRTNPTTVDVVIDGAAPIAVNNGFINKFLTYGEHKFTVSSPLYETYEGTVVVANDKIDKVVELTPIFGFIKVESTPTATLKISGVDVGNTPYVSPALELGYYEISLSAPNHDITTQSINLSVAKDTVFVNQTLLSNLVEVNITAGAPGADIYINGDYKGIDSWQGELLPGDYIIRSSLGEGYRESRKRISVVRGTPQNITLNAPTPRYGKLRVNTSLIDVTVSIDSKIIGYAPDSFDNILVGDHTVEFSKQGYTTISERITITEGKITDKQITFEEELSQQSSSTQISSYSIRPTPAIAPTISPSISPTIRPAKSPTITLAQEPSVALATEPSITPAQEVVQETEPQQQESVKIEVTEEKADIWADENLENMPLFQEPSYFINPETVIPEDIKIASKKKGKKEKKEKKKTPTLTLLSAQTNYPTMDGYGLMIGVTGKVGGYIKAMASINTFYNKLDANAYSCDNNGTVLSNSGSSFSGYNVDDTIIFDPEYQATQRVCITGGLLIRTCKFLFLYAGAGYGYRNLIWQTSEGEIVINTEASYKGLNVEAGGILKFGPVAISAGVNVTQFSFYELNGGIGFMF